jgi:hypothetical protein
LKSEVHARIHIVVVQGHEGGVDDDTESDEQVDEGVEDNDGEDLSEADITVAAVPHAHHIRALDQELTYSVLTPEKLNIYIIESWCDCGS